FLWFTVNRRLSSRGSATFAVSTAALMIVAAAAVASSLAAIADAAGKDLTFTGRTEIWAVVIDRIGQQPILGHGVKGLFGTPKTPETMEVIREIGFSAGHSHNGLLDVLLQLGIVGAVIVIAQIFFIFRYSLHEMRRSHRVPLFGLTYAAGICVMSVGESALLDSSVAMAFCVTTMLLRTARSNRVGMVTRARSSTSARR
ncbi:MAG: O-antigen ligase family protein, partial [Actinobacteria bacterium]|nr:O-antigen ligase family protein [Actinomycetota bacterium]